MIQVGYSFIFEKDPLYYFHTLPPVIRSLPDRVTGAFTILTARNISYGKVMFSQACVKNSVHRRGDCLPLGSGVTSSPGRHPPWADTLPKADTPPQADTLPDGHDTGRYASYWNIFMVRDFSKKSDEILMIYKWQKSLKMAKFRKERELLKMLHWDRPYFTDALFLCKSHTSF